MTDADVAKPRGRQKWVKHNFSNAVVYGGLFHGAVRLPNWILQGINVTGNSIALPFLGKTVAGMADNFVKALGVPEKEGRRLARRVFFDYGRTTIDVWRARSGRPKLLPRLTTLEADGEVLDRGVREGDGKGFLIVSGHIGNWEMGAVSLRLRGYQPAVVGQRELDPAVHEMRLSIRKQLGVESIDMGTSMTTALRVRTAVEKGWVVALVADRAYDEDHVVVPFFGRPTRFLRSPALLARFCKRPILPGFFLRNPDGSYRSVFGSFLFADEKADPETDAVRMMTEVAATLERVVREAPTQWFNFYRYWG